ncbi:MAG: AbrB/MazE/SpoVT family DNA-binding domain-containing protein [Nanoarchaeota archaeon]
MLRKVARIGPSTLMISLPSRWVKEQGITKGTELVVSENKNILTVKKEGCKEGPSQEIINISSYNTSLAWYYLTAAYRRGVEEIIVHAPRQTIVDPLQIKPVKTAEFIKSVVDDFIGMEIIHQTKTQSTIREISGLKEEEFEPILRRIFISLNVMFEDMLDAVKKDDGSALEEVYAHSDLPINKFVDYNIRMLSRMASASMTKYAVLIYLEEIGDSLKYLAKQLTTYSKRKKIQDVIMKLQQLFLLAEKFYYTGAEEIFMQFDEQKRALRRILIAPRQGDESYLYAMLNKVLGQSLLIIHAKLLQPKDAK